MITIAARGGIAIIVVTMGCMALQARSLAQDCLFWLLAMAFIGWSGAVGKLNKVPKMRRFQIWFPNARSAGLAMWAGDVVL
jgi:hypothetical protein